MSPPGPTAAPARRPRQVAISRADSSRPAKMIEVGLTPSDIGQPGGRQTGQRMTHYITPGGPFEAAAKPLVEKGCVLNWHDRTAKTDAQRAKANKQKYTCPHCGGLNAWGQAGRTPDVHRLRRGDGLGVSYDAKHP